MLHEACLLTCRALPGPLAGGVQTQERVALLGGSAVVGHPRAQVSAWPSLLKLYLPEPLQPTKGRTDVSCLLVGQETL
jgi:hypothetical protein